MSPMMSIITKVYCSAVFAYDMPQTGKKNLKQIGKLNSNPSIVCSGLTFNRKNKNYCEYRKIWFWPVSELHANM